MTKGFGVHATRSVATALIADLKECADFVVIDGGKTGATDRQLGFALGDSVIVDRYGKPATFATADSPLDIDNSKTLFAFGVKDFLSHKPDTGPPVVPAGFLQAGDRAALKALYEVVLAAEPDPAAVLRLPVHTEWLAGKDRELLVAVANRLPMNVALLPGGDARDPLDTLRSIRGLISLTQEVPGLNLWGTDLAGLGATVFGLRGWALGMGSGQRHTLAPGKSGRRNSGSDNRPSMFVEELHRWRTAKNLDESTTTYTCEECCDGNPLKALSPDEARRHNLRTAARIFRFVSVQGPQSQGIANYYQLLVRGRKMQQQDTDIKQVDAQLQAWIRAIEHGYGDDVAIATA